MAKRPLQGGQARSYTLLYIHDSRYPVCKWKDRLGDIHKVIQDVPLKTVHFISMAKRRNTVQGFARTAISPCVVQDDSPLPDASQTGNPREGGFFVQSR